MPAANLDRIIQEARGAHELASNHPRRMDQARLAEAVRVLSGAVEKLAVALKAQQAGAKGTPPT